MLEISIRKPIKFFNSCFCSPSAADDEKAKHSIAKTGLKSINGVFYFPEEFLPEKL
jgi:hypothetical protein